MELWQLKMEKLGSKVNKETYLEGREKRNRKRSVDRIEGQGEKQRKIRQATGRSGRLRVSFEDKQNV